MIVQNMLSRGLIRLSVSQQYSQCCILSRNHSTSTSDVEKVKEQESQLKKKTIQLDQLVTTRPSLYPETMEFYDTRLVRISKPSRNVMQYGTAYAKTWKIDFDSKKRWESDLMGWTSSADPLSNLSLNFSTKEDAIAYCEKNKLHWYVEDQPERKVRKKSYADNYSYDKRLRTSNK